ncbi:hypothetical protein KY284_030305 [Solanum tuberosum]|nr:hypothetical protein KY284_030305 [Solanum tuberosum]
MEENRIEQRLVDDKIPYVEALRSGKWINRSGSEVNVEPTLMVEGPIHIDDNISTISEVLKRSLVGFFEVRDENCPTLSEIRRWTSSIWKINHGLNIYEMGKGRFLFEFASRNTAEHNGGVRHKAQWEREIDPPQPGLGWWVFLYTSGRKKFLGPSETFVVVGSKQRKRQSFVTISNGQEFVCKEMLWTETRARFYTGEDKGPNPSVQQISALCPKDNKGKPAADSLKSHASLVQQVPVLYPKENKGKPAIDRL